METEGLFNFINSFGNNKNNKNKPVQSTEQNPNVDKTLAEMYPYGQFPSHYTKQYKEDKLNSLNQLPVNNEIQTQNYNPSPQQNEKENDSGINLQHILPLLASMKDKSKMNIMDMFQLLIPLIAGNDSKYLKDIFKYLTPSQTKTTKEEKEIPKSSLPSIDTYNRI